MKTQIELSMFIQEHRAELLKHIKGLAEDYLLGASEQDLVAFLVDKFTLVAPELTGPIIASHGEREEIRQDRYSGGTYASSETRVTVAIGFTGDPSYFRMRPSSWTTCPPYAQIENSRLLLVFQSRGLTAEKVRHETDQSYRQIKESVARIGADFAAFNATLEETIKTQIQERKRRILERRQMVASVGIPITPKPGAAQTFAVPIARKKPVIAAPVVKGGTFVPEPALAPDDYERILSIMRNMSHQMEHSPSAFKALREEEIRSFFLVHLNGQYQGEAMAEAFNYEGKTDILMRHQGRNVFIAECKIWTGKKCIGETIDQILSYLHWRDTKAAMILFNRKKDFTNVLNQIAPAVEEHQSWKKTLRHPEETEWRFLFRSRDDANREIHLALLAFDVPTPET